VPLRAIARHVLGLYHGVPGGRRYRRLLSEPMQLRYATPQLLLDAMAMVAGEDASTTFA
jgi:tRNA-dihydrouridine synthase A